MYKKLFRYNWYKKNPNRDVYDLTFVQNQIVNKAIISFSILCIAALLAALLQIDDIDLDNLTLMQYLLGIIFISFAAVHKRYSFKARTYYLLTIIFSITTINSLKFGFVPGGITGFIVFCVFSFILLGKKSEFYITFS